MATTSRIFAGEEALPHIETIACRNPCTTSLQNSTMPSLSTSTNPVALKGYSAKKCPSTQPQGSRRSFEVANEVRRPRQQDSKTVPKKTSSHVLQAIAHLSPAAVPIRPVAATIANPLHVGLSRSWLAIHTPYIDLFEPHRRLTFQSQFATSSPAAARPRGPAATRTNPSRASSPKASTEGPPSHPKSRAG